MSQVEAILQYWFGSEPDASDIFETRQVVWFCKPQDRPRIDEEVRSKFVADYELAAGGKLEAWLETPRGSLALVVLLDQFPRHLFRNDPRSFATDEQALRVMRDGIARGHDRHMRAVERFFYYIPLVHSERFEDQKDGLVLRDKLVAEAPAGVGATLEKFCKFQMTHYGVVEKWGRFPHRNALLGRTSTPEEETFLATVAQVGSGTHIVK